MPNGALPTSAAARRGHVTASDYRPTRGRLYIPPVRHLVAKHQNFRINFFASSAPPYDTFALFLPMVSRHFFKLLRILQEWYVNCEQCSLLSHYPVRILGFFANCSLQLVYAKSFVGEGIGLAESSKIRCKPHIRLKSATRFEPNAVEALGQDVQISIEARRPRMPFQKFTVPTAYSPRNTVISLWPG